MLFTVLASFSSVVLGPRWVAERLVWRSGIMSCCVRVTLLGFVFVGSLGAAAIAAPEAVPETAAVTKAYAALRKWVDAFETPKMDDAASRMPIDGASGACVILRRSGRVLGIGVDSSGDALMLRRAAGKAMNEVLGDPALANISAQLQSDAAHNHDAALTIDRIRNDLGRTLTIELEVAGKLVPLVGRSTEQLARNLEPGLDGMALRRGTSLEFAFPSRLRATNTGGDPQRIIVSLAEKSGIAMKDVPNITQQPDIGLYRFRTVTLMQNAADQPPFETFRGDTLVADSAVTKESIAEFANGLARHLLASMWPDPPVPEKPEIKPGEPVPPDAPPLQRKPLGIMGDYHPVGDQYRPLVAPPLGQALAAFALNRYRAAPLVDQATAAAAAEGAARILRDLDAVDSGEENPIDDPVACAVIVYAVAERPGLRIDPTIEHLFLAAAREVADSFDPATGFITRAGAEGQSATVAASGQAILAGAMARLLTIKSGKPVAIDAIWVRKAIDSAWASTPQPQQIALLPWIGWAESDYANVTGHPLAHIDELKRMIGLLKESRIGETNPDGSQTAPDLRGGFALTSEGQSPDAAPLATSQTARPAAWLAGILRDSHLTVPDRMADDLQQHLRTIRFLMQLSVRETSMGLLRNPRRALGGVRAALWDSDQLVPAQALTLITAARSLMSLEEAH